MAKTRRKLCLMLVARPPTKKKKKVFTCSVPNAGLGDGDTFGDTSATASCHGKFSSFTNSSGLGSELILQIYSLCIFYKIAPLEI